MEKSRKNVLLFWLWIVVLAAVKQYLVYDLPIYAISNAVPDDGLMVAMAESMRNGSWLGAYRQLTLVKGIGYPLFLVLCDLLPFHYLSLSSLFYTAGVLVFVCAIRPLFKSRKAPALLYAVLLFSPVAASLFTFQRVYRNSISAAQVLWIFGSFAGLYFRREEKIVRQLPWALGAAVSLVSFYYTREDAVWIMPFVLTVTVLYAVMAGVRFFRFRKKEFYLRVLLIILPLFGVFAAGKAIGLLNQHYYGTSVVNELNDGAFAKMMKTIYSIDDEQELKQTSVSRSKLLKLYENSPSLAQIRPQMDGQLAAWCGDEEYSKVWEVKDGWFFWILRDAMADAGYYESPQKMSGFCKAVTAELTAAVEAGSLSVRPVMPSAMMSPWRKGYLPETFAAMRELHRFANSYEGLHTMAAYSVDDGAAGIGRFEKITGNKAFCYENGKAEVSGWCASKEAERLIVKDAGAKMVCEVTWTESPDVAAHLQAEGRQYANDGNCRFTFQVAGGDYEDALFLCGYGRNGEECFSYPLETGAAGFEEEETILKLDYCYILPNNNDHVQKISWKIDLLNGIKELYALTGPYMWIAGAAAFVYVTVRMLAGIKKGQKHIDLWLVLAGLFFSYLVLLGGIGYTHVSAFDAVNPAYLSAAYPMIGAFWCLGLLRAAEDMVEWYKIKRKAVMKCQTK